MVEKPKRLAIPPLDLSREARTLDKSGTPAALIEGARRRGDLIKLGTLTPEQEQNVLVEYPMGPVWRKQTGCRRFVEFRRPYLGRRYALVQLAKSSDDGTADSGVQ